jgi:hypothetical protein
MGDTAESRKLRTGASIRFIGHSLGRDDVATSSNA